MTIKEEHKILTKEYQSMENLGNPCLNTQMEAMNESLGSTCEWNPWPQPTISLHIGKPEPCLNRRFFTMKPLASTRNFSGKPEPCLNAIMKALARLAKGALGHAIAADSN